MSNPPKKKGTAWESAIVGYLHDEGVDAAERRAAAGGKDRGDIAGIRKVAIEAKSVKTIHLGTFVDEAEVERVNDGADVAVVWIKRRGKVSPADGYVVLTGRGLLTLLRAGGYIEART